MAIKEIKNLQTLDLEGNNISSITPNSQNEFVDVEMNLLLGNNKIQTLGPNAFASFTKFKRLDLSYNQVILTQNFFFIYGYISI